MPYKGYFENGHTKGIVGSQLWRPQLRPYAQSHSVGLSRETRGLYKAYNRELEDCLDNERRLV